MNINKDDARNFIIALNAVLPYVPPMHMQPLITNPICRMAERLANADQEITAPQQAPIPMRPVS